MPSAATVHPTYRADIDGLRAVAVLSVVGFHAFPAALPGGFVGVDIFFVISGFLISTILLANLERGSLDLLDFYGRRIRRLFPALIVVLVALLVFGWFVLLPAEYGQLGEHTAGGAGFVANLLLWNETGYFEKVSSFKPLLHLWSLGVEEQFYIVWPGLLWLAWRIRLNALLLIVVLGALSFAFNLGEVRTDPVGAFYSPLTRFWELLVGAVLAYAGLRRWALPALPAELAAIAGGLLIAAALWLVSAGDPFPGSWALLPTLGAAGLIAAGPGTWVNRALLAAPGMVWFGLISYPLYLWHWPLMALAPLWQDFLPLDVLRALAVPLSIALAWATWRWVERPLRAGFRGGVKAAALVASMVVVGGAGWLLHEEGGARSRTASVNAFLDNFPMTFFNREHLAARYRSECNFYKMGPDGQPLDNSVPRTTLEPRCHIKQKAGDKVVFLWGDSHASMLAPGLENNLPAGWEMLVVATSGCTPSAEVAADEGEELCARSNRFALDAIRRARAEVVVVAYRRGHTLKRFSAMAAKLKQLGVQRVVFLGPAPQFELPLPTLVARRAMVDSLDKAPARLRTELVQEVTRTEAALARQLGPGPGPGDDFVFVDLVKFFCNSEGCLMRVGPDLVQDITSWDYGHLTPHASDYLVKNLLAKAIFGDGR